MRSLFDLSHFISTSSDHRRFENRSLTGRGQSEGIDDTENDG